MDRALQFCEREDQVETRGLFGHWEIDTIIGRNHRGAVVTIVERQSRYTLLAGLERRTAAEVETQTIRLLEPFGCANQSITADNGKEFTNHEAIAGSLGINFYLARPYHSWERGTNENTNGLIRQYLPKSMPLDRIDIATQNMIMDRLNNRPRKVMGYRTPAEVLSLNLNSILAVNKHSHYFIPTRCTSELKPGLNMKGLRQSKWIRYVLGERPCLYLFIILCMLCSQLTWYSVSIRGANQWQAYVALIKINRLSVSLFLLGIWLAIWSIIDRFAKPVTR